MTDATTGCVHCHQPLELRQHESIQLLACTLGHGVFLHADALREAVRDRTDDRPEHEEHAAVAEQGSRSAAHMEATETVRTCPMCGASMRKQVFAYESGVVTDVCDEHGVWLDEGELQQVEAWHEAQERLKVADMQQFGGPRGRLEQIEEQHERALADEAGDLHWGPIGWIHERVAWWWMRRDDR